MYNNEQQLITWNDLAKEQKTTTKLYLAQVIQNMNQNAIDKRILKNLDQNDSNKSNRQIINKIREKTILKLEEKYNEQNIDNVGKRKDHERYHTDFKEEVIFQNQTQENFTSNNQNDATIINLQEDDVEDSNIFDEFIEKDFNV
ncbi:UNKNOWN [Stylonychia lemnae]|uniref:Uncharacterized protein n=1 Tax=Stylonychia lemnae TaxID=5949 RepID=A0A078B5A9_STYLE|nr:UNKNOWN [Stylonychia lemnae]|eukprot:CDW89715.1 UNKNOWN [Stylonychia lemnae]